eukprot:CAMPEP_0197643866 /NCGR_PEP_ID=MMETSP1338-20131121/17033_1 /TAXON_ID=43686 ORGANISM="Pelagodinium beii, Strain RCC1491" /NCGR_SAMPLE_ID=MMETSP1338 /ASSEMBLY_ACC=CAM_ASM_000754 /LENGTH=437 /DNA_ID=CAMNT_0043217165 /DNA_START=28 /DNA_END=1341 /DNA_ORIENTATION=+
MTRCRLFKAAAKSPEEEENGLLSPSKKLPEDDLQNHCFQSILVAAAFATNFGADLAISLWSLRTGKLSPKTGLDWECYYFLFTLNGFGMLLQAGIAIHRLPNTKHYAVTAFAVASVSGMMPLLSDSYDTLKDVIFATLCLESDQAILKILGICCLLWLLAVHCHLIFFRQDCVGELAGSYLPILNALPDDETTLPDDEKTKRPDDSSWLQKKIRDDVWPGIYKQTTPPKQSLLLEENGFQTVAAILYIIVEGGSPFVIFINLAVPILQYVFALTCHGCVKDLASPWLGKQLLQRINAQHMAKADDILREFGLATGGAGQAHGPQIELMKDFAKALAQGQRAGDALATALEKNQTLVKVNLSSNGITDVAPLAAAIEKNQSLLEIFLQDNQITDVAALAAAIEKNQTLKTIFLHGNPIKDTTALEALREKKPNLSRSF